MSPGNKFRLTRRFGNRRPGSTAPEAKMRIILVATAVAAAMSLDPRASQAYERPWCALTDIGGGVMHENCTLPTFEMCVQEVIAGNRGFCIPNPRWQGPRPAARQPGGGRKRVDN